MSHWGWHSFPLPEGWTPERVPATGTFQRGRNKGGDIFPPGTDPIRVWMFDNPHIMNLGRLRLVKSRGRDLTTSEISGLTRIVELWSGLQTSNFRLDGQPVSVETCVHPTLDLVAVRILSPLLASGELEVVLDFAYPALRNDAWVGDFQRPTGHATEAAFRGTQRMDVVRKVDAVTYHVSLATGEGCVIRKDALQHAYTVSSAGTNALAFVCAFSTTPLPETLPAFAEAKRLSATHWESFWRSGGAIDLAASKDSRWKELERRIVLSQYQLAAQSSGSWPSSEMGLLGIDPWRGQFHMEMVWWHLAHYPLWNRWNMAGKALDCYRRFTPAARALAAQLGYQG